MRLALFIFCISFVVESSARTMKQFLMAMPDSVLPVLSLDNRLDAVDFLESGMKATVQNNFGESSTLLRLSDDYASWELSTVVSCELKLLVSGADTTICMSTTYHSPFPESVLTFYNKDWQPRQCVVEWPTDADFRQIPEGYTLEDWKDLRNKAGMMVLQAKLQEKAQTDHRDPQPDQRIGQEPHRYPFFPHSAGGTGDLRTGYRYQRRQDHRG